MLNEEIILQELQKCYFHEGEEEIAEKTNFLMENLVKKIAPLFENEDQIFWCGHEKNVNIWAATPVKSPVSLQLWDLFGASDAKFIFLTNQKAVYINVMRMLEEGNLNCYSANEVHSILGGYYWTKKKDEISSRAVRIVAEEHSDFHASVNISNNSYNDLVEKVQKAPEGPIKEKIIILDDTDSIKKYHSTASQRRSWSKTNI